MLQFLRRNFNTVKILTTNYKISNEIYSFIFLFLFEIKKLYIFCAVCLNDMIKNGLNLI